MFRIGFIELTFLLFLLLPLAAIVAVALVASRRRTGMTECRQCGAGLPEGARFCPACGNAVESGGEEGLQLSAGVAQDDRNMAVMAHLSALAGFLFPFGNIIGPLIVWLLKRQESPFIDSHGKAALNFQISLSIYMVISAILIIVIIGIVLLIALGLFGLIAVTIAAVRASEGREYQYPLAISFIR